MESFIKELEGRSYTILKAERLIGDPVAYRRADEIFLSPENYTRVRTQPEGHVELLNARISIKDLRPDEELPGKRPINWNAIAALALFLGLSFIGYLYIKDHRVNPPVLNNDDHRAEAYLRGIEFVKKRHPGAKTFSSFTQSKIEAHGTTYLVGFTVDGLNAFGGPVRNLVAVEMKLDGSNWLLVDLQTTSTSYSF